MRVLIVDDERELVEPLVERLELRGLEVTGEMSGRAALETLGREAFDVIVLDVKMPEISGLDLLRRIKASKPAQKVVLMTGHGSRADAEEGKALGAFEYMMKPVRIDDLLAVLKRAAETHGPGSNSSEKPTPPRSNPGPTDHA
jgi:DNA-binding NtrC family response regulator